MNKQKIASSIVLLFSLFLMVSCTNEPVDSTLAAQLAAANSQTSSTEIYKWKCEIDGVLYEWEGNPFTNPGGAIGAGGQATYVLGSLALQKINSSSAGISITAQMQNNTTGNFVFNASQPINITITDGNPQNIQGTTLYSSLYAGTINMNIASISNDTFVANPLNPGKVIGTFSGTIGKISNVSTGQITTSVVTNGSFEAIRAQ